MDNLLYTEATVIKAKSLIYKTLKSDIPTIEHSFDVFSLVNAFYPELPERYKEKLVQEKLLYAALLHDIGKSSIAVEILSKPGELTAYEREIIKKHAVNGKKILEQTRFKTIADCVCYHHERMDGNGYYRLTAEQTPLESKIISIADTYSAITSDRVYRKRRSIHEAMQILGNVSGTQLDGDLVNLFCTYVGKRY